MYKFIKQCWHIQCVQFYNEREKLQATEQSCQILTKVSEVCKTVKNAVETEVYVFAPTTKYSTNYNHLSLSNRIREPLGK
jgi:hypothetical protein